MGKTFLKTASSAILKRHRVWLLLLLLTATGGGLRIFCWAMEPTVSRDGLVYIQAADVWNQTDSFDDVMVFGSENLDPDRGFWPPPLPIFLIKLLMKTGWSAETAGLVLNLVLGTALIPIIYLIASQLCTDRRVALAAALLTAVHPALIDLAGEVQRDTSYLFLIGLSLIFLVRGLKFRRWYDWSIYGALFGAATLTRYETLEFLPIVAGGLALALFFKEISYQKALLAGTLILLFFMISGLGLSTLMGTNRSIFNTYYSYFSYTGKRLTQLYSPERK